MLLFTYYRKNLIRQLVKCHSKIQLPRRVACCDHGRCGFVVPCAPSTFGDFQFEPCAFKRSLCMLKYLTHVLRQTLLYCFQQSNQHINVRQYQIDGNFVLITTFLQSSLHLSEVSPFLSAQTCHQFSFFVLAQYRDSKRHKRRQHAKANLGI
jgi:hypothetical protein